MDTVTFIALMGIWLLVAIVIGIKKRGFALVMVAFALMWTIDHFWDERISWGYGREWFWFLLFAIPIGIYALMGGYRARRFNPRHRTWAGALVLALAVFMAATPLNINLSALDLNPFDERSELVAQMEKAIKADVDEAIVRIEALEKRVGMVEGRVDSLESRVAALETSDKAQNTQLTELEGKVTGVVTTAPPIDLTSDEIAEAIASDLVDEGFRAGDITVGKINWDENIRDVGDNPFVDRTLDSIKKLRKQLNASTDQAKSTRVHLVEAVPTSEEQRMLSGRGFIPVQFNKRVCLEGNTYFLGGKAERGPVQCHDPGDVIWVYVGSDKKVYWDASVRADCGNGGMSSPPRPNKEKKSDKKSNEKTPGTPGTRTTSTSSTSTPTPSRSTSTPTPSRSTSTPSPSPSRSKATFSPAPSVSPRPGGTSTAEPSSSPTHSGSVLSPGPQPSSSPSSDGNTATQPAEDTTPATGTIGNG